MISTTALAIQVQELIFWFLVQSKVKLSSIKTPKTCVNVQIYIFHVSSKRPFIYFDGFFSLIELSTAIS